MTTKEPFELLDEEGLQLTDEELEGIAGGIGGGNAAGSVPCPDCRSTDVTSVTYKGNVRNVLRRCQSCGAIFWENGRIFKHGK